MANKPLPGPYDLGPFQEMTAIKWGDGGELCPDGQWYFELFDDPASFGIQNFMFSDSPGNSICALSARQDYPSIANLTYIDQCGRGSQSLPKVGLSAYIYGLSSGAMLSYFDICGSPDIEDDGINLPRLDGIEGVAMQGQKWSGNPFLGTRLYYFGDPSNSMASKGFVAGEKLIYGFKMKVTQNSFQVNGNVLLPNCLFASTSWDHYELRMVPETLPFLIVIPRSYTDGFTLTFRGMTSGAVIKVKPDFDCPDPFDPRNFAVDSTQYDYQWLDYAAPLNLTAFQQGTAIDSGFIVGEDAYLTVAEF